MTPGRSSAGDPIVVTYSQLADEYDDPMNLESCWGRATEKALARIALRDGYRTVVDLGCGTGRALVELAGKAGRDVRFIGLEPAAEMRARATERTRACENVEVWDGRFEAVPLAPGSVDYLYSIMAFHWTTDVDRSVDELARVLGTGGEMDLVFIGRWNGREFIEKTTPIFLRYLGPAGLLESAGLRKQLTRDAAFESFSRHWSPAELTVEESFDTYYDTLDGHWGWWVRIEGQFLKMPPDRRRACDEAVREALSDLETDRGIPYTIHALHVRVRRG